MSLPRQMSITVCFCENVQSPSKLIRDIASLNVVSRLGFKSNSQSVPLSRGFCRQFMGRESSLVSAKVDDQLFLQRRQFRVDSGMG